MRQPLGQRLLAARQVTGAVDEEIDAQIREEDFDGILPKPLTSDQLFDALISQLSNPLETLPWAGFTDKPTKELAWGGRLANKRVLLVDDDRFYRKIGAELLTNAGIQNALAINGEVALNTLANSNFDLVLMDIHMPVMDGIQAVQLLRNNPAISHLPVLAMTAGSNGDQDTSWISLGFNDILRKPIAPEALYERLECWILGSSKVLDKNTEDISATSPSPANTDDRETAGLVLLVKNPQHRGTYQALFRNQAITKVYEAVADFRADLPYPYLHESCLASSGQFFLQTEINQPSNSATLIEVIKVLSQNKALYRLTPSTGKKHQLRVHMASLGMGIEGDQFYPIAKSQDLSDFASPLQLLARSLCFTDPISQQNMVFTSQQTLCLEKALMQ